MGQEISLKFHVPHVPHSQAHMDVKQGLIEDKVGRRKEESKMSEIAGKTQKRGFRVVLIFTKVLIFLSTVGGF